MQNHQGMALKLLLCIFLTLASIYNGMGTKCGSNAPTIKQTPVGFGNPQKYIVEIQNKCPMCPLIDLHVKCGSFPQALVNPKMFKVLAYNDCVVNDGLPLGPLQKFSFNYSHDKYLMYPSTWHFQCE